METSTLVGIVTQPIQRQVYEMLHASICDGHPEFRPGSRLNVAEIAASLNVSVTPVKEALKKLESDGLIVVKPRSGTYVSTLTEKDMRELTAVRKGLETMALALRAEPLGALEREVVQSELDVWKGAQEDGDLARASRAHRMFHRKLVALSGNAMLVELYDYLMSRASLFMAYHANHYILTKTEIENHQALLDAVAAGDRKKLETLMEKHFDLALQRGLESAV